MTGVLDWDETVRFDPGQPRDPATGQWIELYHGTKKEATGEAILAAGLTADRYSPYNRVLTKRKDEAAYFAGAHGSVVTVRVPTAEGDEYIDMSPQGLASLKKPLPARMIHQVEHVSPWRVVKRTGLDWDEVVRFDPREKRDARGRWTEGGLPGALPWTVTGDTVHYQGSLDIPRERAPQFSGTIAGKYAGPGEVIPKFRTWLRARNITTSEGRADPGQLRPIKAAGSWKVVRGLADEVKSGKRDPDWKPVIISADNYVVDGTQTWAAKLLADSEGGPKPGVKVLRVNVPLQRLLDLGEEFMAEIGMPHRKAGQEADPRYAKAAAAAPVWQTADGRWTITTVKLRNVAKPTRHGDPEHGDGEYLFAKTRGLFVYAKSVDELVKKTGIKLTDLREVKRFDPAELRDAHGRWRKGGVNAAAPAAELTEENSPGLESVLLNAMSEVEFQGWCRTHRYRRSGLEGPLGRHMVIDETADPSQVRMIAQALRRIPAPLQADAAKAIKHVVISDDPPGLMKVTGVGESCGGAYTPGTEMLWIRPGPTPGAPDQSVSPGHCAVHETLHAWDKARGMLSQSALWQGFIDDLAEIPDPVGRTGEYSQTRSGRECALTETFAELATRRILGEPPNLTNRNDMPDEDFPPGIAAELETVLANLPGGGITGNMLLSRAAGQPWDGCLVQARGGELHFGPPGGPPDWDAMARFDPAEPRDSHGRWRKRIGGIVIPGESRPTPMEAAHAAVDRDKGRALNTWIDVRDAAGPGATGIDRERAGNRLRALLGSDYDPQVPLADYEQALHVALVIAQVREVQATPRPPGPRPNRARAEALGFPSELAGKVYLRQPDAGRAAEAGRALRALPPGVLAKVKKFTSEIVVGSPPPDWQLQFDEDDPEWRHLFGGVYDNDSHVLWLNAMPDGAHGLAQVAVHEAMHAADQDGHPSDSEEWQRVADRIWDAYRENPGGFGMDAEYDPKGHPDLLWFTSLSAAEAAARQEIFAQLAAQRLRNQPLTLSNSYLDPSLPEEEPLPPELVAYVVGVLHKLGIDRPGELVRAATATWRRRGCLAVVTPGGAVSYRPWPPPPKRPARRDAAWDPDEHPRVQHGPHGGWFMTAAGRIPGLLPSHRMTLKDQPPGSPARKAADARLTRPQLATRTTNRQVKGTVMRPAMAPWDESVTRIRDAIIAGIDAHAIEEGKAWYPHERAQAEARARAYGVSVEQAAGVMAATSPRCSYAINQRVTDEILDVVPRWPQTAGAEARAGGGVMGTFRDDAVRIALGADIDEVLTGPKRRAFFNNIVAPGRTDDVTVDTWMYDAVCQAFGMSHDQAGYLARERSKDFPDGIGMPLIADATRDAAAELRRRGVDVTPDAVQAAFWVETQRRAGLPNPSAHQGRTPRGRNRIGPGHPGPGGSRERS